MPKRRKTGNHYQSEQTYSKMWKKQKSPTLSTEGEEELKTLFGKHFKYSPSFSATTEMGRGDGNDVTGKTSMTSRVEDFVLFNDHDSLCWEDEKLMTLKREMNDLKNQLSGKDIEMWHAHTTACNLAGKIIPYVKTLHVELCTQAWVKFYEILSAFKIVPDSNFISIHLCEAPGAFVAALNHYLQLQAFHHHWAWRATTLNPYHEANSPDEMIADDRLFRPTSSHCYFGSDGSGDIRAAGHIAGLQAMTKTLEAEMDSKVMLVTADGSRDCQENPAQQEPLLSQLHYCEMIAACLILASGGNFVLKMFTMFESASISLMFLLNVMFEEVHAFKPATSKSGNSETYLICMGYRKNVSDGTLWKMLTAVLDGNVTCFIGRWQIPNDFMEEHRNCCHQFAQWQASTIRRNMDLFDAESHRGMDHVHQLQEAAVELFIERTHILYSRYFKRLVSNTWEKSSFQIIKSDMPLSNRFNPAGTGPAVSYHKGLRGTFTLRQNLNSMAFTDRIALMSVKDVPKPDSVLANRSPFEEEEMKSLLCLEKAQGFDIIRSSRLCDAELLKDLNTMFKYSKFLECRAEQQSAHEKSLSRALVAIVADIRGAVRHCPDLVQRRGQPAHPSPRQRKCSSSEDVETQTLTPEWSKRPSAWSCSLSCSPGKSPPSRGSETDIDHDSNSSTTLHDVDTVLHLVVDAEGEENVDSSFHAACKDQLSQCSSTVSVLNLNETPDVLKSDSPTFFIDLTLHSGRCQLPSEKSVHRELLTKRVSVKKILWAFQHLPRGSRLVVMAMPILTRFTAGLVYCLARSFSSIRVESSPNVYLHQLLVLDDFQGSNQVLVQHLTDALKALDQPEEEARTLVEVVRFRHILNDRKFVQFTTTHNNFLLASFINLMLKHYGHS